MKLTAKILIERVSKKTDAKLFKDLKKGDVVFLSYDLGGIYKSSPTIVVELQDVRGFTLDRNTSYAVHVRNALRCFVYQELLIYPDGWS